MGAPLRTSTTSDYTGWIVFWAVFFALMIIIAIAVGIAQKRRQNAEDHADYEARRASSNEREALRREICELRSELEQLTAQVHDLEGTARHTPDG